MADRATKRKRADTLGATAIAADFCELITSLPSKTVQAMLAIAAARHADIAQDLRAEAEARARRKAAQVIDFDHLSKTAWHAINVKVGRLKGSARWDMATDACGNVEQCLREIQAQSVGSVASMGTKRNGLLVCRKIAKSVALAPSDMMGREVSQWFHDTAITEDTMLEIAEELPVEVRREMWEGEFGEKLEELEQLGKEEGLYTTLGDLILVTKREEEDQETEDESEQDEGDMEEEDVKGDVKGDDEEGGAESWESYNKEQ